MLDLIKGKVIELLLFFFKTRTRFVLFIALMITPLALLQQVISNIPSHPSNFTVMITNITENSGGSGSVIATSNYKSIILTNAHVCDVLNKSGGIVKKEDGTKYMVSGYRKSLFHDLCAVYVSADLGVTVKVATAAPATYSEATITGHPSLLPNIINKGSFGERKIIEIMTGVRPCTEKDLQNEQGAMACFFLGGVPIISTYESIVVSAIIAGGSSGSAVLNSDGKLSGVVFAGQGEGFSYAFVVPFEYVYQFVNVELANEVPATKVPLATGDDGHEALNKAKAKLKLGCLKGDPKSKKLCSILKQDVDFQTEKELI